MAQARTLSLSGRTTDTLLISCRLHDDAPTLDWDERGILQTFIRELHEPGVVELLTWCILPRSYRFLVYTNAAAGPTAGSDLTLIGAKMKILQSRFRRWRKFQGVTAPLWKERFKSSPLPDPGHVLAAAASVDGIPVALGLVDDPEDYYFCGYHHACQGDRVARTGICKTLDPKPTSWAACRQKYRRTLAKLSPD